MKRRVRNSNFSFNNVPVIKRPRSAFPISTSIKTSLPIGKLVPYKVLEVNPGDTWSFDDTFVIRSSNPFLKPVMEQPYYEVHHFFVRNKTVFTDWDKFITGSNGDGEPSDWQTDYTGTVPCIPFSTQIPERTVGDYLGYPTKVVNSQIKYNILPFRAFAKIWNEWYRDENVSQSTAFSLNANPTAYEVPNNNAWSVTNYFGKLPPVAKYKDYFTSALPQPQKGQPVQFNLNGFLPVVGSDNYHSLGSYGAKFGLGGALSGVHPVALNYGSVPMQTGDVAVQSTTDTTHSYMNVNTTNLVADGSAISFDVNDLRTATALQLIRERLARSGSRMTEYLLNTWGVRSPDATLQRSQFLGGKRCPILINQVSQTAPSTDGKVGDNGAFALSGGHSGVSKAFTEHGWIISCISIRYNHTYQQGLQRQFARKERFDYLDPALAHIGEQPIYQSELLLNSTVGADDVFGYKGAWDELRSFPSQVTGQMRTNATHSFDIYHFADDYVNAPVISASFINEDDEPILRTMGATTDEVDQFLVDVYRKGKVVRVLPTYSVPGFADHP